MNRKHSTKIKIEPTPNMGKNEKYKGMQLVPGNINRIYLHTDKKRYLFASCLSLEPLAKLLEKGFKGKRVTSNYDGSMSLEHELGFISRTINDH
ncbi:MAG: hypothetical protein KME15_26435 [Drouetiella hepatica Uher 2000/2452]|jgi:hypothetical protein|uniref:Uncharacterized protein n=1 Tax=Drouetiella hepatica Uher 2000/2452 TaxID=904376 RepID=A0A951QI29_9CYAN|nr:hypothetical protein [Drouetiella hepatica Uher 2000/2452]